MIWSALKVESIDLAWLVEVQRQDRANLEREVEQPNEEFL